jgi:cephalosporin hydroxylase
MKGDASRMVTAFHRNYYKGKVWERTYWQGAQVLKCPLDLWIYQELIHETCPELVIETGTWRGGSALYLATVSSCRVVSIDITNDQFHDALPQHPNVTYLSVGSTDPECLAAVRELGAGDLRTMVVLDSDHSAAHVRSELELYAPLVASGCYAIVEDTNLNGHPVVRGHGPGPMEAVEAFLRDHDEFESDRSCEKFLLTFNPKGYLRRKG